MSFTENKRSRWFTVADALIIVIALLFIVGAAFLFLMPTLNRADQNRVIATLQISFENEDQAKVVNLETNSSLFCNGEEIGTIVRKTPDNHTVYAEVELLYEDGVYYYNGNAVRINGEFVLETRLDILTGRVVDIQTEG